MLLKDIILRADISMIMVKPAPAKESIYVGTITLTKNGKKYTFKFDSYIIGIVSNAIVIECRDGKLEDIPEGATLEELEGATVTNLFLQGDKDSYVKGQAVQNIELTLYDVMEPSHKVIFEKDAFKEADLGKYYDITWEM